ncbi:MAG: TSCPD domain-containing protein, partial [Dehalococcoidia bacterium]|nr:TSCPD domain-containing protein [Dehalococcoidia bacterium]
CNLGSINLSKMVNLQNGRGEIAYDRLAHTVKLAVRFLDNVIDVNNFPLPQIAERTRALRKIGLGIMGFADMLADLSVPYDSPEALTIGEKIMQFIDQNALEASMELAQQRGEFPAFKDSIYASMGLRVRNATRTTIAPTGTLSIISGCSSGIEPLFALAYTRNILDGEKLIEVNPRFEEIAKKEGFYSKELIENLAGGKSLKEFKEAPDKIKRLFVTAHDISPEYHVLMQSAFQKHTNNAVSKTVNFPHDASLEDVAKVYMLAYQEGLKGITIYRDRSRENQVLSTSSGTPNTTSAPTTTLEPRKRPKITKGVTEKAATTCGTMYVTVNSDEHGLCEVFSSLGKAGGCASAQLEAISRLISLAFRSGVSPESVVKQIRGIRCPSIAWEDGHANLSCADA